MLYVSQLFNTPMTLITRQWNCWKEAYNRASLNYYNQLIERYPEAVANDYWQQQRRSKGDAAEKEFTDEKLSQLMHTMIGQGVSKFAADCFVLELRRLRRSAQTGL